MTDDQLAPTLPTQPGDPVPVPASDPALIVQSGPPANEADAPNEPVSPRVVFRWSVAAAIGVLLVAATVLIAYQVRDLLVQIGVAAFIALSLDPAVRWLIRHRVARRYAVTIIALSFLIAIGVVIWLAAPPLASEATKLGTDFPGYLDNLRHRSPAFATMEARLGVAPRLNEFAANFVTWIQREALAFGQRFLGAVFTTLLIVVLTIYFMSDLPRIRRAIVRMFSVRRRPQASHAVNVVIDKVGAYMIGNLIISLIAGVTTFAVLFAVGVPFALPLAVFVAITDLIPLIGATLGAVVCTLVALATTDLWPGTILVAGFFVLYQQLENYLIAPRVLRNTVDMPSVALLLVALIGSGVFGLVGALISIPIAAAVKVLMTPVLRARDAADAEAGAPTG